jgi:hypothetical protein
VHWYSVNSMAEYMSALALAGPLSINF